jgi:hypothetical protein
MISQETLAIPPKISKNSNRKKYNNNNNVPQNVEPNENLKINKLYIFSCNILKVA